MEDTPTKDDQSVLNFIVVLTHVCAMFRDVHVFANKHAALFDVTTDLVPVLDDRPGNSFGLLEVERLVLSVALGARLRKPFGPEVHGLLLDFDLSRCPGEWLAEVSTSWLCTSYGSETIEKRSVRVKGLDELEAAVTPLLQWGATQFKLEADRRLYAQHDPAP